jgi:hypothetical protein
MSLEQLWFGDKIFRRDAYTQHAGRVHYPNEPKASPSP